MCLAVPGQLLEIQGDDPLLRSGRVSFGGIIKEVYLAYTPEAKIDDYVLVHVGFAISVIDETEAQRVFRYLDEIGAASEIENIGPATSPDAGSVTQGQFEIPE